MIEEIRIHRIGKAVKLVWKNIEREVADIFAALRFLAGKPIYLRTIALSRRDAKYSIALGTPYHIVKAQKKSGDGELDGDKI